MKLINEDVEFRISTSGAEAKYTDDGELFLRLCAKMKSSEKQEAFLIEIHFQCVAELICRAINFYESNHNQYEVVMLDEDKSDTEKFSGFYRVLDSHTLEASNRIYDPQASLKLKHYLVTGGDGYFEVIASSYFVAKIPSEGFVAQIPASGA